MITRTTLRLHISRGSLFLAHARAWLLQRDPLAIVAVPTLLLVVTVALIRQLVIGLPVTTAAQPTPQLPIIIMATAQAHPVPTPAAAVAAVATGHTLARAAVAYDAPNGNVLGALESGRAYTVLARFGADWLQADVSGSGVVWLKSADVLDLPDDLADLQPPPAPAVVYVSAPAPAVEQRVEAAPTPAPQYQVLSERQANIQQHYIEIPTLAPMEQTDVTQEWARQQYLAEHP